MHSLKVETGGPLLAYLLGQFPQVPKTRVKKWLRLQCVSVNGKTATKHDFALRRSDEVKVEPGKKTPLAGKSSPKIVYQDESIMVVDKPAGLLTVATEKEKEKTVHFQLNQLQRVFIVHRLDRETSGLLVFAKNEEVKFKLQHAWDKVDKRYTAVVEGTPRKNRETLKSHLAQNKTLKVYSTDEGEHSKFAVTHYQVLRTNAKFSLLEIRLETGRKNQIRVQLADIGHPVAGDKKYGSKENPAGRLALHAHEISLVHPVSGQKMTFKSPIPKEISRILG